MISITLRGQLGNQCFQAATTIAHALKYGTDYCFPSRSGKRKQFEFALKHLPINDDFKFDTYYREKEFGVYNEILPPVGNQLLQGYFQSEKYFKDYRKEVIIAFGLPKYLTQSGIVGIHVRRGDYVRLCTKHPPVSKEYIEKAMSVFSSSYKFMFFSDDLIWCEEQFQGDKRCLFYSEGNPIKALAKLASCEHIIISNSTFGWWGGWLNENRDKVVVSPHEDNWFALS